MIEDASDDLGPHALPLIGPVDDHIPDGGAIDKVGEDPTEPNETITIPGTEGQIGMAEHVLGVIKRSVFGPRRLLEQSEELRCFRGFLVGVGDGGLEGWRHLILKYPPN